MLVPDLEVPANVGPAVSFGIERPDLSGLGREVLTDTVHGLAVAGGYGLGCLCGHCMYLGRY